MAWQDPFQSRRYCKAWNVVEIEPQSIDKLCTWIPGPGGAGGMVGVAVADSAPTTISIRKYREGSWGIHEPYELR